MTNLTKAQKELVTAINDGYLLQVVGVTGEYRHAVLSPADSNPSEKDSRRKFVNAKTVNKLFSIGLLEEKTVNGAKYAELVF